MTDKNASAANAASAKARVPAAAENPLGGDFIQVNFCKSPTCANFGVPARVVPVKPGPSEDRDDCYAVQSTSGGLAPGLRCKSCGEKPIIKSNAGIAEEIQRLTSHLRANCGCPNEQCAAHGLDVVEYPFLYQKYGSTNAGTSRVACKLCMKKFVTNRRVKFFDPDKTEALFLDFINKAPMKRTLEKLGWQFNKTSQYYRRLDLINAKCQEFLGSFDRRLARGEFDLGAVAVSTDVQQYTINWDDCKQREYTLLNAVFSVDNASGYIFCANVAYDPDIDAAGADSEMVKSGEHKLPEAYRKHARLWMMGDAYDRNRGAGRDAGIKNRADLVARIEAEYAAAMQRADCEDAENGSKSPKKGKLVHYPYTVYASMFILERLTLGARRVVHCLDHESVLRAACLTAFENRIRKGTAHAFFASVNKEYTVPERQKLRNAALAQFRVDHKRLLRGDIGMDEAIAIEMMKNIREASKLGPWRDNWVKHPLPRMDEPEKRLCWLTGRGPSINEDILNMFLGVSMNGADNAFQQVRRRISMLERPLLTASAQRRGWNGYAFYKPENVQKALNIFRCYLNFCVRRQKDGKTAAMRLGIAAKPYTAEDILNCALERHPANDGARIRTLYAVA